MWWNVVVTDSSAAIFPGRIEAVPITLSDEEFDLLYLYLHREHRMVFDPKEVGETTKIGRKLWARVQEIADEQGFTPQSTAAPS
jgi:hypothetical protein